MALSTFSSRVHGGSRLLGVAATVLTLGTAGCGLTEVALVPEVDALVVEAGFQWRESRPNEFVAWVHRSLGPSATGPVDATVELILASGDTVRLDQGGPVEECVSTTPEAVGGSCYRLAGGILETVQPGDRLGIRVTTPGGEFLDGGSTVPGTHTLITTSDEGTCQQPPYVPLNVGWTQAEGAWAYVNETLIFGLREAFAAQGIEVEEDPLALLGLSISAQDTTVVFPSEFGLFQRGDLDQDLAVALQQGLPPGTSAEILVGAADRNLVNWARGGNFNPSGQVRVPSLRGDGTGYFGSSILRSFLVIVEGAPVNGVPLCQSVELPSG